MGFLNIHFPISLGRARILAGLAALLAWTAPVRAGDSTLLDGLGLDSTASREEGKYTCVPKPPPARPAQFSGAEGLPPLPLPAVPLRRTEKKNPPRPPVLIAKIATASRADWATNPGDADNLLRWMAQDLKVHFSAINLPQDQVPASAREVPLLYRTGHDAFEFPPAVRQRLRAYLLQGGTVVFDACCGRRAFVESALREMNLLVPERPPYRLPPDHPLFRSFVDISQIQFRDGARQAGAQDGDPGIIGVDVGCRTAVFLFRWDVSCGWDNLPDSEHHHCLGYTVPTARALGANLTAYITAEREAAVPLSKALAFVDASPDKSGKFLIAQARYGGQWRTRDAGLSMLLNSFHEQTKTPVRFALDDLALDSPRLFDVPFLYLTGHHDFTLSGAERAGLRRYLRSGGLLLAEACCGRSGFDRAFRRELRAVLPEAELAPLPAGHPLFHYPNAVTAVQPRPALAQALGVSGRVPPRLLAVSLNGQPAVIYSPWGLACGWELAACPYCQGPAPTDALALGVNILSWAVAQ
ncbi:MAG: DUF4159 domain-containing protein [Lentisphaeria bacterium]